MTGKCAEDGWEREHPVWGACSMTSFINLSTALPGVKKTEIRPGDCLLVRTRNSLYTLCKADDGHFIVSGGWFDRKGKTGIRTGVTGCSFGGSMIKIDVVVACGLCIEFANRLITTPVKSFAVLFRGWNN